MSFPVELQNRMYLDPKNVFINGNSLDEKSLQLFVVDPKDSLGQRINNLINNDKMSNDTCLRFRDISDSVERITGKTYYATDFSSVQKWMKKFIANVGKGKFVESDYRDFDHLSISTRIILLREAITLAENFKKQDELKKLDGSGFSMILKALNQKDLKFLIQNQESEFFMYLKQKEERNQSYYSKLETYISEISPKKMACLAVLGIHAFMVTVIIGNYFISRPAKVSNPYQPYRL